MVFLVLSAAFFSSDFLDDADASDGGAFDVDAGRFFGRGLTFFALDGRLFFFFGDFATPPARTTRAASFVGFFEDGGRAFFGDFFGAFFASASFRALVVFFFAFCDGGESAARAARGLRGVCLRPRPAAGDVGNFAAGDFALADFPTRARARPAADGDFARGVFFRIVAVAATTRDFPRPPRGDFASSFVGVVAAVFRFFGFFATISFVTTTIIRQVPSACPSKRRATTRSLLRASRADTARREVVRTTRQRRANGAGRERADLCGARRCGSRIVVCVVVVVLSAKIVHVAFFFAFTTT